MVATYLKLSSSKFKFETSIAEAYAVFSSFRPSSSELHLASSLNWGLQLLETSLGENVLEEDNDEVEESESPSGRRVWLENLQ